MNTSRLVCQERHTTEGQKMTNYYAINYAEDWELARCRQIVAGEDEYTGNLSFHETSSKDKNNYSTTSRIERYEIRDSN